MPIDFLLLLPALSALLSFLGGILLFRDKTNKDVTIVIKLSTSKLEFSLVPDNSESLKEQKVQNTTNLDKLRHELVEEARDKYSLIIAYNDKKLSLAVSGNIIDYAIMYLLHDTLGQKKEEVRKAYDLTVSLNGKDYIFDDIPMRAVENLIKRLNSKKQEEAKEISSSSLVTEHNTTG